MVLEYGLPLWTPNPEFDAPAIGLDEPPQISLLQHSRQKIWQVLLAQMQLFNHDALRCRVPALADMQLSYVALKMCRSDFAEDMQNDFLRKRLEIHDDKTALIQPDANEKGR
jgi:hypothetical protein